MEENEFKKPEHEGMRFKAACHALQGLMANPTLDSLAPEEIAHDAVNLADALLEALEETPA